MERPRKRRASLPDDRAAGHGSLLREEVEDSHRRHRLAASGFTDNPERLTGIDEERDILDTSHGVWVGGITERDFQLLDLKQPGGVADGI
jgi:hypothetical protein